MSWPDAARLRWSPTRRVASDDGTRIAVEVLGDSHPGPTLVFVHGWTLSSRFWHYQRSLAERWRLVLMDHRDHGESALGPRDHRTIDQLGRDLGAVLAATCRGREVILVGHSMGGMTIMALAAAHPELFGEQVRGVALVDTSARREIVEVGGLRGVFNRALARRWQATLSLMSSDPQRAEPRRRSGSALSVAISRWFNFGPGADRRLVRFVEAMTAATPAEVMGDFWVTLDTHDKAAALATLGAVPTLVVVGDRDRLTPPADARAIAAAVPGSRLLELRGAGHCAALEQPDAVNAALRDLVEQATRSRRTTAAAPIATGTRPEHHRVVVVGAGFSGIGASIALAGAGIEHIVLERAHDVGGTWLANTYPGCRCDVASHLYSFSFAPNPDWVNSYSSQEDIWRYLKRVAEDHGVIDRVRFGCAMENAAWDDTAKHWVIGTSQGTLTADVLIAANGPLSEPSVPRFEGAESFRGPILHSAQWDGGCQLAGRRVAVVGTGASAVQIVPAVHREAAHLVVFQRTAAWIMPHRGRPISGLERRLYRRVPLAQRIVRRSHYWFRELVVLPPLAKQPARTRLMRRLALAHLNKQVADPELRRRLTPTFVPGCKRLTPSNDYLPAIASPTTTLVTDPIAEFVPEGIRTADGTVHEVDVIILATGFKVTDPPIAGMIHGRDGQTLKEAWTANSGMCSYNGTTTNGFPNLYIMAGPNTGIGHTSLIYMIEAQIGYVVQALRLMEQRGIASLEVRRDVEAAWDEEVQRKMSRTVWNTGGCVSWYLDENGRNTTLWPDFSFAFARRLRRFDLESYHQELRAAGPATDTSTTLPAETAEIAGVATPVGRSSGLIGG